MPEQTTHPSPEELSAFNLGQLPPAAASAVEDHISECDSCCETLLGLASSDTFVDLLKEVKQSSGDESKTPTVVTGIDSRQTGNVATIPEALTEHSRYEIVRLIGKGGMGDVFEARHRMMDRTVALKVINHEFIRKPQAVDRFHREVKAAARLSHPNIVTAYDAEQAGDLHFLVMEYVDGVDLANLVKDRGRLPVWEACDFARQAAIGLQHAHEQGMVHRDIKPHNLMVTEDGTVKILDFGLASLAPELLVEEESQELSGELTAAGAIIGTPDFISPEQARDAHQADIRSDIYSLGATLYYLLSGRAPFADVSVIDKLKHHAELEPLPLETLQIEIPDELADVIRRMMAKDPAERYQTPREVADALAPFVDEHRTAPAEKTPVSSGYKHTGRRWPWITAGLAAAFIALAGIIYVETDNGTLVIESEDDNVEITIGRPVSDTEDGLEVKVVDRVTGSEVVRLPSGGYRLMLGKGEDTNVHIDVNSLQLSREQFTLSRGDKVIVRVTRKPLKGNAANPPPTVAEKETQDSTRSPDPRTQFTKVGTFERHGRFAYNAVVSPDGKYAVSCGGYRTIQVWDLETQQEIRVLLGHKDAIAGLAVSATGRLLASGDKSGMIRLWNLPTGEHLGTLTGHNGFVSALAFLPDGRLLSAASDKTLRIWDVHQQKLLRTIELGATVEKMEPLWDNRHVMLSGAHTGGWGVVKYDLEKGETLDPQPSAESCLAVANDRRTTLIGTVTGMLRVYDEESGKLIVQMADPRAKAARDAAILPGNRYAITTTRDGQMHLWDLVEGKLISSVTAISIGTVSLSPDGRYALTFGRGAVGITVWRLPDSVLPKPVGSPLSLIRTTAIKHYGQVLAMDFSADSKQIITGDGSAGGRRIRKFDTRAGWKLAEFNGLRDTARAISSSPDGKIVAVGDMDSTIHLLDAKSLEEIDTIDDHGGWVECLEFSADSRRLASGSTNWGGDGEVSVRVWDVASRKELWRQDLGHEGNRGSVESLCFSPDGTQLVTAHFAPKQRISIWNAETGELTRRFGGPDSQIRCVRFSPDGRSIATAHRASKMLNNQWNDPESCIIRLYDAASGEELQQLRGHQGPVLAVEFTPDGKYLVSGGGAGFVDETGVERPASEYSVRFWDVATGEQVLLQKMSKPIVSMCVSPDGSQLATSAGFNKSPSDVQLWRINYILKQPVSESPPDRQQSGEGGTTTNHALQFDEDSRATVRDSSGNQRDGKNFGAKWVPWPSVDLGSSDQRSSDELIELGRLTGHTGPVKWITVSLDGRYVASASGFPDGDKSVRVWDLSTRKLVRRFAEEDMDQMLRAQFTRDGKHLWACGADGQARLWKIETGRELGRIHGTGGRMRGLELTPDGKQVVVACGGRWQPRVIAVHDAKTGERIRTLNSSTESAFPLAFDLSPDGRLILCRFNYKIQLFDVESGKLVRTLSSHQNNVEDASFSHDSRRIVSGGQDDIVRVWDVATGEQLREFHGHTETILSTVFTPDDRHVVSAGYDGTVKVWHVESAQLVTQSDLPLTVWRAVVTPDGKHIICGGGSQRDAAESSIQKSDFELRILQMPKSVWSSQQSAVETSGSQMIDSRVLLEEFRRFYAEQAPEERSEIEKKSDPFVVAMGITTMRVHSPGFLRVTRRREEAFARGEFDDSAARKRIESVLPKLKNLKVQLPVMTRRIVSQYEAQPFSGARLELAAHLIQAAFDRVQPQNKSSNSTIIIIAEPKASRPFDWKVGDAVTVGVRCVSDDETRVIGVACDVKLVAVKDFENRVQLALRSTPEAIQRIREAAKTSEYWFEIMPFQEAHRQTLQNEVDLSEFLKKNSDYRPAGLDDWGFGAPGGRLKPPAGEELPNRK